MGADACAPRKNGPGRIGAGIARRRGLGGSRAGTRKGALRCGCVPRAKRKTGDGPPLTAAPEDDGVPRSRSEEDLARELAAAEASGESSPGAPEGTKGSLLRRDSSAGVKKVMCLPSRRERSSERIQSSQAGEVDDVKESVEKEKVLSEDEMNDGMLDVDVPSKPHDDGVGVVVVAEPTKPEHEAAAAASGLEESPLLPEKSSSSDLASSREVVRKLSESNAKAERTIADFDRELEAVMKSVEELKRRAEAPPAPVPVPVPVPVLGSDESLSD